MGLFSSRLPLKTLVRLSHQLAKLADSDIPLVRSLELIGEKADQRLKRVLMRMSDAFRTGAAFEEALRAESKYFPVFLLEMLVNGERAGRLAAVLEDLAEYYEDRLKIRRSIIRAVTYPLCVAAVIFYVIPFCRQYVLSGFDLARCLLSLAYSLASLGVFIAICAVLWRVGVLKPVWGFASVHVWPFASLTRKFNLARFFRSLGLLFESGMHPAWCIERSAEVLSNPLIRRDLLRAAPMIGRGATLDEAFAQSRFVPAMARRMIRVGEESGRIDFALRKVSEYLLNEADHRVRAIVVCLEAILILALGFVILAL